MEQFAKDHTLADDPKLQKVAFDVHHRKRMNILVRLYQFKQKQVDLATIEKEKQENEEVPDHYKSMVVLPAGSPISLISPVKNQEQPRIVTY